MLRFEESVLCVAAIRKHSTVHFSSLCVELDATARCSRSTKPLNLHVTLGQHASQDPTQSCYATAPLCLITASHSIALHVASARVALKLVQVSKCLQLKQGYTNRERKNHNGARKKSILLNARVPRTPHTQHTQSNEYIWEDQCEYHRMTK